MKVVTGSRLSDGAAVYLADDDQWTRSLREAARFGDDDADPVLAAAQSRITEIADAYLIEVDEKAAPAGRQALRESIRKAGPTVGANFRYRARIARPN